MTTILASILSALMLSEINAWLPWLSMRFLRIAVKLLPERMQERYYEEWAAVLMDTPGKVFAALRALDFIRGAWQLRRRESRKALKIEPDNEMLITFRETQAQLKEALTAAQNANRAKSQFLANMSHELRTPLNAMIGFSSMMTEEIFGPLSNPKYVEYTKYINESATHVLDIINDILDLTKVETGNLTLIYEEMHLDKVINKCIAILSERAHRGKITISTEVPKALPLLIADRLRVIQILLNVISNAVKFTEEGGAVHISVNTKEMDGKANFIITVRDTGIGMSDVTIDMLFQKYESPNHKYEGTGLGLPLTVKLMELHHGKIYIESELNIGTTVILTFPTMPSLRT